MELAGLHDITIQRGATYSLVAEYNDAEGVVDLTGATARMQVRRAAKDATVLLELSSQDGQIVIDADNGTVTVTVPDEETATIAWDRGVYDLFLYYSDGRSEPLLEGRVTVSQQVTR